MYAYVKKLSDFIVLAKS